jgi:hypothetical protein
VALTAALTDIATIGPFFHVHTHHPGTPPSAPWRPMSELTNSADVLAARVDRIREALGASAGRPANQIEVRVAASAAHLGLTARILSPLLALTITTGVVPAVTLNQLYWQDELGGAFPLSISAPIEPATPPTPRTPELAAAFSEQVLDGPITAINDVVCATRPVSNLIMWGNVASAVVSAGTLITKQRPFSAGTIAAVTEALFQQPPLRGTGNVGPPFRRRSCCLIYRIASPTPTAICGDCPLVNAHSPRNDRSRRDTRR